MPPKLTIKNIISRFMPCEVCGNRDINRFRLRVLNGKSTVKCEECEEEYFTPDVDDVLKGVREERAMKRTNP